VAQTNPPELPHKWGEFDLWPDYPPKTGIPAHKPRPRGLRSNSLNVSYVVSAVIGHVVGAFLTVVLVVIELIGVDIVAFVMVLTRLQIIVNLAFVVMLEAIFVVVGRSVTKVVLAFTGPGVIVTVMEAVFLIFVIVAAIVFVIIAAVVVANASHVGAIRTRHLENNTLEFSEVVQDLHRYIKVVVRKRRWRE
jgi:hypothetical protein